MIHRRRQGGESRGIGMTSRGTRDRLVQRLREEGIRDERVLEAIQRVPRHEFVDEALSSRAYEDTALPIGLGQTISQPWIVARMTEALLEAGDVNKVLEIGTGSGYQAAVLAQLVREVYTVERIKELLKQARRRFHAMRLHNVHARHADGYQGWSSQAPFDGILVTAASRVIPEDLVAQLRLGGRMVIPLETGFHQRLLVVERTEEGYEQSDIGGVIFVPMLSGLE